MNSAGWQSEGVPPGDLGSGDLPPGDLGADELALRTLASGELPSPLLAERALAAGVAAGLERLIGLFRWLSPPSGLSLTAAATLATLDRGGPRR